eukprot:CAMPEP_0197315978 /NCGR_PEP_ID=MMETSP0891-20130614/40253_1 /TAXON_ID=44058 ORGANISM="Aureoumbra lagunensis, Strain CCMP1510" /NCGR_SAMPLE_ID=MMETSP0891 /ASSEMBLY_ACC=CAM_ASM_000534 /LENGTH=417 /DNA_ID=CAMNT_0042805207 /DNA_START=109 /DNA_END=1363 /DNA_ORIENTATION=+
MAADDIAAASYSSSDQEDVNATGGLYASLRSRQRQVAAEKAFLLSGWRKGRCSSRVAVVLEDDWVRRCDFSGRLIALGTASGNVHVVDVQKGVTQLVTRSEGAVSAHKRYAEKAQDLSLLHGSFDGGGVTALALNGNILATGGREGDLKLWRAIRHGKPQLEFTQLCGSDQNVVSAVAVLDATVIAGCLDGSLRLLRRTRLETDKDEDTAQESGCWSTDWFIESVAHSDQTNSSVAILCLAATIQDESNEEIIVCGCSDGTVKFFRDGVRLSQLDWQPFPTSSTRSLTLAPPYIYAGSSDGALKRRRIDIGHLVYDQNTYEESLFPNHSGSIVSLVHREGILCSGSTDGTIRIWDLKPRSDKSPPSVCYGFGGFKVWLGSLACDEKILLSDGSDNTIICHDFSSPPPKPTTNNGDNT